MAEVERIMAAWDTVWPAKAPRLLVLDGKADLAAFDDRRLAAIGLQRIPGA